MCVLKVKVISLPYIFPGFVCFVLYLVKISGERLQDHWSSGCVFTGPIRTLVAMATYSSQIPIDL